VWTNGGVARGLWVTLVGLPPLHLEWRRAVVAVNMQVHVKDASVRGAAESVPAVHRDLAVDAAMVVIVRPQYPVCHAGQLRLCRGAWDRVLQCLRHGLLLRRGHPCVDPAGMLAALRGCGGPMPRVSMLLMPVMGPVMIENLRLRLQPGGVLISGWLRWWG